MRAAPAQPATGQAEFIVFVGGKAVGREQVNLARSAGNWIITSSGNTSGPVEVTNNRASTITVSYSAGGSENTLGTVASNRTERAMVSAASRCIPGMTCAYRCRVNSGEA